MALRNLSNEESSTVLYTQSHDVRPGYNFMNDPVYILKNEPVEDITENYHENTRREMCMDSSLAKVPNAVLDDDSDDDEYDSDDDEYDLPRAEIFQRAILRQANADLRRANKQLRRAAS